MPVTAPYVVTLSNNVPNVAAGSTDSSTVAVAPFAGTVTSVTFTPDAGITGHATNNRTVSIINKEDDGTGTTAVAELEFDVGVDATAFDETAITLSGTAADLVVAEGDVLAWSSVHAASGVADPGGTVTIKIARS